MGDPLPCFLGPLKLAKPLSNIPVLRCVKQVFAEQGDQVGMVAGTQQASAPKIVKFLAIDLSGFGQSSQIFQNGWSCRRLIKK